MKKMTQMIAVGALSVGLMTMAPAAHAEDKRPCVSTVEFQGVKYGQSRAQLEKRWEVEGLGVKVRLFDIYDAIVYPRCGYPSTDKAWYGAVYTPGTGLDFKAKFIKPENKTEDGLTRPE